MIGTPGAYTLPVRINHYGDGWVRAVCDNTIQASLRAKHHSFGVWIRWRGGGSTAFQIIENSYEYLHSIEGTDLEKSMITIWTARGDKVRLHMGEVACYQVFLKERESNPLNHPDHYENPLN